LHPSKIMIKTLNLDDKRRKAVLDRKKPIIKKGQKAAKKATPKKVIKEPEIAAVKEEAPETEEKSKTASQAEGGK
jgi:hypothetical protein